MPLSKLIISFRMRLRSGRNYGEEEDEISNNSENSNELSCHQEQIAPLVEALPVEPTMELSTFNRIKIVFIRGVLKFIYSVPTLLGVIGGIRSLWTFFNETEEKLHFSFVNINGETFSINKINSTI